MIALFALVIQLLLSLLHMELIKACVSTIFYEIFIFNQMIAF